MKFDDLQQNDLARESVADAGRTRRILRALPEAAPMLFMARLADGGQLKEHGILLPADSGAARVIGRHGGVMSGHRLSHC